MRSAAVHLINKNYHSWNVSFVVAYNRFLILTTFAACCLTPVIGFLVTNQQMKMFVKLTLQKNPQEEYYIRTQ